MYSLCQQGKDQQGKRGAKKILTEDPRCKAKFSMVDSEIHRCDLYDGHDGNHKSIMEWTEEESDY